MKMSMNIPNPERSYISELSERYSMTATDIVRRAVRVLKTLDDAQHNNREILIRDPETLEVDRLVIL